MNTATQNPYSNQSNHRLVNNILHTNKNKSSHKPLGISSPPKHKMLIKANTSQHRVDSVVLIYLSILQCFIVFKSLINCNKVAKWDELLNSKQQWRATANGTEALGVGKQQKS